jgi:endonuclease G, mitochondrial
MLRKLLIIWILIFIQSLLINAQSLSTSYPWVKSIHTELGVPFDDDSTNDFIIIRPQYVLSYNQIRGVPNWVAWNLNASWYGDAKKYSGDFIPDSSLPDKFYKVTNTDYATSNFEYGQMVRSEERSAAISDNKSTFFLTNVLPVKPNLKRGAWLDFEYFCEDLCKQNNKELYIVAGGIFNTNSSLNNEGKVTAPDSCFKIVVVLERGQKLSDVSRSTLVYSVVMPNTEETKTENWSRYSTSVDRIEALTGYNFLANVPEIIQDIIERNIFTGVEGIKRK